MFHNLRFCRLKIPSCSPTKFVRSCSPSNRQRLTVQTTYRVALLKSSHMNWLNLSPLPVVWKESNIRPIPKIQSPMDEGDFRPILLTPCLSKVLEDFVVTWLIDDVKDKIDPNQFGCLFWQPHKCL